MKLTLTCEHGTRTVEFDEGREGIGNIYSISGKRSFAAALIAAATPHCPYCELEWIGPDERRARALGVVEEASTEPAVVDTRALGGLSKGAARR